MTVTEAVAVDLRAQAREIAETVAGKYADAVDRDARFPREAIDALRTAGLLAALIPTELGGGGARLTDVALACEELGKHCSSTAMIFAMHQIQVACLVDHGDTAELVQIQREIARHGLLLASATTEIGIGGDTRSSTCAVVLADGRFTVKKQAPVISYGEYADIVMTTARRDPDSPPGDQVLVVCARDGLTLARTGDWDTMGFRGTCSPGFILEATGPATSVVPVPYATISSQTMLPVAHILWGHVWFGLATAAVDKARRFVRKAARSRPGTVPPGALRVAELMVDHQKFGELVHGAALRYENTVADPTERESLGFAIAMNTVKVAASEAVVALVGSALLVTGIAGYREDTEYRMGRLVRDSYGAALMVNNDRILHNTAQLLLVHKD